jgi:hypothetical protein
MSRMWQKSALAVLNISKDGRSNRVVYAISTVKCNWLIQVNAIRGTDGRDFRLNRVCSISPFNTYRVFNFNIDICFIMKHT